MYWDSSLETITSSMSSTTGTTYSRRAATGRSATCSTRSPAGTAARWSDWPGFSPYSKMRRSLSGTARPAQARRTAVMCAKGCGRYRRDVSKPRKPFARPDADFSGSGSTATRSQDLVAIMAEPDDAAGLPKNGRCRGRIERQLPGDGSAKGTLLRVPCKAQQIALHASARHADEQGNRLKIIG
jgi:hypothetical protein